MKKTVLTVTLLMALSFTINAQDNGKTKTKTTEKKTEKKEVVNADGTTSVVEVSVSESAPVENKEEGQKPKTRMAINEKGLPGDSKSKPKTNNPK